VGPGIPGWIDLGSIDMDATKRFYGALFGWEPQTSPDPAFGGYTIFTKDGKAAAGAGPLTSPDQPQAWNSYVIVEDVDDVARRVEAAGGKVVAAPMDIADQGRMAMFLDPEGVTIAAWQPDQMPGAGIVNEPGSLCWNELRTRDLAGAKAFYPAVFDWGVDEIPMGDDGYVLWKLDGREIGGAIPMTGEGWPAELAPHWGVYFAVEDCDAAAATIGRLGGAIAVPPMDTPQGRIAAATDPLGVNFNIIALKR
jgi:predicted enzyme related to lactoylglutathione lyase